MDSERSAVVVAFQTFFRPLPVTVYARSVCRNVHLVRPVTFPVTIWGTISLLLNLGQTQILK